MRLSTIKVKAIHVPVDSFVFLPKENSFFWVDDKEVLGTETHLIFELGIGEKGLIEDRLVLNNNKQVEIVLTYNCDKETQLVDIQRECTEKQFEKYLKTIKE